MADSLAEAVLLTGVDHLMGEAEWETMDGHHVTMLVEAVPRIVHDQVKAERDQLRREVELLRYDKQRAHRSLRRILEEVGGDPYDIYVPYVKAEALRGLKRKAR